MLLRDMLLNSLKNRVLGVLENRIFEISSQTPRLPIAKATVKVTLVYIPVPSAGGEIHG
jgi:hypothetical protein